MREESTAEKLYALVQAGREYKAECGLYDTVRRNENFFVGRQWEGVNAPKGLDKPVINILKRVVSYFVSMIHSDDLAISVKPFYHMETEKSTQMAQILAQEIERTLENCSLRAQNRDAVRNCAVDGDCCCYVSFNPHTENGQRTKGEIQTELILNTDVIFGNEETTDVQRQPYIIAITRRSVAAVRKDAAERGLTEEQLSLIEPDEDERGIQKAFGQDKKVNVYTCFYKKNGIVFVTQATKRIVLMEDVSLGYRLYPFAWMCWDKVQGSYHGQAAISGMIPNQVFVNKLYAMAMQNARLNAFPKIIYNENLLPEGWSNSIGQAIGVCGDPTQAVASGFRAPDMSTNVTELIQRMISDTRDSMGASDAALGNVRPDNTSAIIAVQQASAMPLELNRLAYYTYVEEIVRIIADVMCVNFGVREIQFKDGAAEGKSVLFDFSTLREIALSLNVDIGAASYWGELMQVQTLDSLMKMKIIPDAKTYLEAVPDRYLPNKRKLLTAVENYQKGQSVNEV